MKNLLAYLIFSRFTPLNYFQDLPVRQSTSALLFVLNPDKSIFAGNQHT